MSSDLVNANLTIVQGNIRSAADVRSALTTAGRLPDRILSAVGGSPVFQFNLMAPISLDDPHICEGGMATLLSTLKSCLKDNVPLGPSGKRPSLIAISTISISRCRDIPYLYYPLEYWLLNIPRADKMALERVIHAATKDDIVPFDDFAMVRPPLLLDGPAKGIENIRVGWIWAEVDRQEKLATGQRELGPQIGYTVAKRDVGLWIYENLIKDSKQLDGRCFNLTY